VPEIAAVQPANASLLEASQFVAAPDRDTEIQCEVCFHMVHKGWQDRPRQLMGNLFTYKQQAVKKVSRMSKFREHKQSVITLADRVKDVIGDRARRELWPGRHTRGLSTSSPDYDLKLQSQCAVYTNRECVGIGSSEERHGRDRGRTGMASIGRTRAHAPVHNPRETYRPGDKVKVRDRRDRVWSTGVVFRVRSTGAVLVQLDSDGPGVQPRAFQEIAKVDINAVMDHGVEGANRAGVNKKVDELMDELQSLVGLDNVVEEAQQLRNVVEFDFYRKKFFCDKTLRRPDLFAAAPPKECSSKNPARTARCETFSFRECPRHKDCEQQECKVSLSGQSLHMKFLGNPGTGKTVVARIVGQLLVAMDVIKPDPAKEKAEGEEFIFVEADRSMLVGEHLGETAIKTMKVVESALGGVLFIDEAYSLVQPGGRDAFGKEAVDTLIKEMEDKRDKLIVILAGYSDEMTGFIDANPGFKSRVPISFNFEDYTCSQLVELAGHMAGKTGVGFGDAEAEAHAVLRKTIKVYTSCCEDDEPDCTPARDNGNGRTVRNILESARRSMAGRVMGDADQKAVDYLGDFKEEREAIQKKAAEEALDKVAVKALNDALNTKIEQGTFMAKPPATLPAFLESLRSLEATDFTDALEEKALNVLRVGLVEQRDQLGDTEEDQARYEELEAKIAGLKRWVLAVSKLDEEEERTFFDLLDEKEIERATDMIQSVADARGVEEPPPFAPVGSLKKVECTVDPAWTPAQLASLGYADPQTAVAQRRARCEGFPGDDCAGHHACVPQEPTEESKIFADLMELQGLEKVKRKVGDLYLSASFADLRFCAGEPDIGAQSFHMTFLGNPGTGKTEVGRKIGKLLSRMGIVKKPSLVEKVVGGIKRAANALANMVGAGKKEEETEVPFVEVSRADLVGQYLGHTAPKVKKAVESALGGVLFVDEAYSIVKDDRDKFGHEAVDTLIKEMEDKRDQVIVIMAGYEKEMTQFLDANPGFKSRVPFSFLFDDYKCSELVWIGKKMYEKRDLYLTGGGRQAFERLVEFSTGCCEDDVCESRRDSGNGRAVRNIVEQSLRHIAGRVTKYMKAKRAAGEDEGDIKALMTQATTADLLAVYQDMVNSQLKGSCRANGMLDQMGQDISALAFNLGKPQNALRQALHRSKSVLKPDNLRGILMMIKHLEKDAAHETFLRKMPALKELAQSCVAFRKKLFAGLHGLTKGICNSADSDEGASAIAALLTALDEAGSESEAIKEVVKPLKSLAKDAQLGMDLIRAGRGQVDPPAAAAALDQAKCRAELDALSGHQVCVPFSDLR